jgi:hypothetical protein
VSCAQASIRSITVIGEVSDHGGVVELEADRPFSSRRPPACDSQCALRTATRHRLELSIGCHDLAPAGSRLPLDTTKFSLGVFARLMMASLS